jgi:outer membrane protein assembly factor BamB
VSCHELTTGELLWSTFVVRGQVERNMFGKTVVEFDAAPLVAVRERRLVLAQTGLGVVAALDLATGKVLWRTDYSSIPIPKTRSYSPSMRETAWKTTPPVITGDVVLATPRDSRELLALDIADGHVLWRVEDSALSTIEPPSGKADVDHLIGVEGNVLYFGGIRPAAFIKRSGMRSMEAPERLWSSTDVRAIRGRGQLSSDGLYVPLNDGLSTRHSSACLVLDRESGKSTASHQLNSGSRGLLVTDEALYVVTDNGLERIER